MALEVLERRLDPASRAPFAVAFSGGGDSLALLLAAREFAQRTGRPLAAIHVDHGLQPRSSAWADEAEDTAAGLGVRVVRLAWTGPKPSAGVPAAARAARHRLIADACRERGVRAVLIGHTLDDQLENALMRGAGVPVGPLREWGPSPVWPQGRGLFVCRPLLAARRCDLRAWLAREGLNWLDDPANADIRYARARARLALAEGAEAEASSASDIRPLAPLWRVSAWGGVAIDRAGLVGSAPRDALRLLQLSAACVSGAEGLARPGRASRLLERLGAGEVFTAGLGGARIKAASDRVALEREAGEAERGGLAPLQLEPGQTAVWDGRFEMSSLGGGLRVEALRGQAARLDSRDRAAMLGVAASARPALPVFRTVDEPGTAPRLALAGAGAHIDEVGLRCRALCEERLAAASGLVTREADIGTIARMALPLSPSYVRAGSKD
ncbi:MAG: tRNA lysidine(34) synthetase TilS [Caulobacteraceae bacterium]